MKKLLLFCFCVFSLTLSANAAEQFTSKLPTLNQFSATNRYQDQKAKKAIKKNILISYQNFVAGMHKPSYAEIPKNLYHYERRKYIRRFVKDQYAHDTSKRFVGGSLSGIASIAHAGLSLKKVISAPLPRHIPHHQIIDINLLSQIMKQNPSLLFFYYPDQGKEKTLFSFNENMKITTADLKWALGTGLAMGASQIALDKKIIPQNIAKEVVHASAVNLFCNKAGTLASTLNEKYDILDPNSIKYYMAAAVSNAALPFIGTKLIGLIFPRPPINGVFDLLQRVDKEGKRLPIPIILHCPYKVQL